MSVEQVTTESLSSPQAANEQRNDTASSESRTTLSGTRLLAARTVWATISLFTIAVFIASLGPRYRQLADHIGKDILVGVNWYASDPRHLGISPDYYATFNITFEVLFALVFVLVGLLIAARKSDDWMALLSSLVLITYGAASIPTPAALAELRPEWRIPAYFIQTISWILVNIFFFMFPDGRFIPRWGLWYQIPFVAVAILWNMFPESPYSPVNWPAPIFIALVLITWIVPVFAQIYRYRNVSTLLQRQQTKWIVYGLAVAVAGVIVPLVSGVLLPRLNAPDPQRAFYELAQVPFSYILLCLVPASVAISILRYRLYDIDLIISRTLVYIPLTGIVAGLYAASTVFFQKVFVAVTGEKSDAAIVLTTLILASTFTPIKNAIQAVVDRRFKEAPNSTKRLEALGKEISERIYEVDTTHVARRLLNEAVRAYGATCGGIYLAGDSGADVRLVHTCVEWRDDATHLAVSLEANGETFGVLRLGPRPLGRDYSTSDREVVGKVCGIVAEAIADTEGSNRTIRANYTATPGQSEQRV